MTILILHVNVHFITNKHTFINYQPLLQIFVLDLVTYESLECI